MGPSPPEVLLGGLLGLRLSLLLRVHARLLLLLPMRAVMRHRCATPLVVEVERVPGEGGVPEVGLPDCLKIRCLFLEEKEPYLRTAAAVRGPVVESSPGRRARALSKFAQRGHRLSTWEFWPPSIRDPWSRRGSLVTTALEESVCGTGWSGGLGAKGWYWGLHAALQSGALKCGL